MAIAQGTTRTTTGTKDYIVSGFGTPTAYIVFFSNAGVGSNPDQQMIVSTGFGDGTNQASSGAAAEYKAVGNSNTVRCYADNRVIWSRISSDRIIATGSIITDGVRLNFTTTNDATERYVKIVLFKGTSNVYVDAPKLESGGGSITAPGFKPDLIFFCSAGNSFSMPRSTSQGQYSFGFAHNNSSDVITQGCHIISDRDGQVFTTVKYTTRNDSAVGEINPTSDVMSWAASITMTASGFDYDYAVGNTADYAQYLALKFNDPDDVSVDFIDTPSGAGTASISGLGFQPEGVILIEGHSTAFNTLYTGSAVQNMSTSVGVADTIVEAAVGVRDENGAAGPNNPGSYEASSVGYLYLDDGSITSHEATISYNSDGYNLNFSKSTANKWIGLSFKGDGVPPPEAEQNAIFHGFNF